MTRLLALALALAACHPAPPPPATTTTPTPPTAARAAAPFASFDGGGGAPSVTCDEADPRVRRHYDGTVAAVQSTDHGWAIVVTGKMQRLVPDDQGPLGGNPWKALPEEPAALDRDRFFIAMPAHVPLPLAVGDAVWAEIWTVQVGAFAFDGHAWVSRNADGPVLVVDEVLPGWSVAPGGRAGAGPHSRAIAFAPPGVAATDVYGWARGGIGGVDYAVYGDAEILDPAAGEPPPDDWADVVQHAVVRLGR